MDNVTIILTKEYAQGLYQILDKTQIQGLKAKVAIVAIMIAIETALNTEVQSVDKEV